MFDANPKAIQQINFNRNIDNKNGNSTMFFIIVEVKKAISDFHKKL